MGVGMKKELWNINFSEPQFFHEQNGDYIITGPWKKKHKMRLWMQIHLLTMKHYTKIIQLTFLFANTVCWKLILICNIKIGSSEW